MNMDGSGDEDEEMQGKHMIHDVHHFACYSY